MTDKNKRAQETVDDLMSATMGLLPVIDDGLDENLVVRFHFPKTVNGADAYRAMAFAIHCLQSAMGNIEISS